MTDQPGKPEFWETAFADKQEMWGLTPAASAIRARDLFLAQQVSTVLVPGMGYGRNARVFADSGMEVTGIEISTTAARLARKHYGSSIRIYEGPVADMPFDDRQYDGIFCHALIHLLDAGEPAKLISDCFAQLSAGGYMVFTVIANTAASFGQGTLISENRYEQFGGVRLFFYDEPIIRKEFGKAGLVGIEPINENQPFFFITCAKKSR